MASAWGVTACPERAGELGVVDDPAPIALVLLLLDGPSVGFTSARRLRSTDGRTLSFGGLPAASYTRSMNARVVSVSALGTCQTCPNASSCVPSVTSPRAKSPR